MLVKLLGGPQDGTVLTLRDGVREHRIHGVPDPLAQPGPDGTVPIPVGIYAYEGLRLSPMGGRVIFLWKGWT